MADESMTPRTMPTDPGAIGEDGRPTGTDEAINPSTDLTIITAVREFKAEAKAARRSRMAKNRTNRMAFMNQQDWSSKLEGQSKEFLPKTAVAVEQITAFVKRAMTQFGDWYEPILGIGSQSPLTSSQIRELMNVYLNNLVVEDGVVSDFATLATDGVKVGSLESLIIFKVHGVDWPRKRYQVTPGGPMQFKDGTIKMMPEQLQEVGESEFRLRIDLVDPSMYFPDPTGRGLYEIHESEHDFEYAQRRAEEGLYDPEVVSQIKDDFETLEREGRRLAQEKGQDYAPTPSFRRRIMVDEFWGTLLDSEGYVASGQDGNPLRNIFCTIINEKWIVRKPTPNPFWHQESPFVAFPLIRVPFSVWHRALMDGAVEINLALNELFNLIIDGGMASVWGIKQLRIGDLEDPRQVQGGIDQGTTLIVKNTLPHNAKVLENVGEGSIPSDSMVVFEALSREFVSSALTNEIKMGSLPPKQVRATEIVELQQSQAVTFDNIVGDIERAISRLLRLSWLTILQYLEKVPPESIVAAIGVPGAFSLYHMTPPQRYAAFHDIAAFKVYGLSAVLGKARDFQKLMALMQSVATNPVLMMAFFKRFSPNRILSFALKTLGMNPLDFERDEQEFAKFEEQVKELMMFMQLTKQQGGGASLSGASPDSGMTAEVNQSINPMTGLTGQE